MCHFTIIGDNQAYIHLFSSVLSRTDFDEVYVQLNNTRGICHFKNNLELVSELCSEL